MTHVDRDGLVGRISDACFGFALVMYSSCVSAGVVVEPNMVYANLSDAQDKAIDSTLKAAINSSNPECWVRGGGLIYMKKRPHGMDDSLIKRAVLQGSLAAKKGLSKALLTYRDDEVDGLDGVVLYVNRPSPRFASMTAKSLTIRIQQIADVHNTKDVELAFCAVKPDVVRAP